MISIILDSDLELESDDIDSDPYLKWIQIHYLIWIRGVMIWIFWNQNWNHSYFNGDMLEL